MLTKLLFCDLILFHKYPSLKQSMRWPMDEPQCTFVKLLRFLTSFSHVNLSLVPLNLENVTVKPRHITRPLSVPGLTTTLYIAFNKRFSELLHLQDDRTDDDRTATQSEFTVHLIHWILPAKRPSYSTRTRRKISSALPMYLLPSRKTRSQRSNENVLTRAKYH
jgi:hypothetical protein